MTNNHREKDLSDIPNGDPHHHGTERDVPAQTSGNGASTALAEMLKRQRTKPAPPAPPADTQDEGDRDQKGA
jgi:hypothetical protein